VQDTNSERFFGFINFETAEGASKACTAMHGKEVEGCKLYVDRAQSKAERQDILKKRYEAQRAQVAREAEGRNCYVKNLTLKVDEAMLKNAFSVRSCFIHARQLFTL
jgi:polyadenylate-binding protein